MSVCYFHPEAKACGQCNDTKTCIECFPHCVSCDSWSISKSLYAFKYDLDHEETSDPKIKLVLENLMENIRKLSPDHEKYDEKLAAKYRQTIPEKYRNPKMNNHWHSDNGLGCSVPV